MKKTIITILCALAIMGAGAQKLDTISHKATDNVTIQTQTDKATKSKGKATGLYYPTKDGQLLPAYQGSKGGIYVKRVSKKTGNSYHQYLNDKQKAKLIKK